MSRYSGKRRGAMLPGLLAALPDALTATAFAIVWVSPLWFGLGAVKTALLTMLVEFFLVHATGFYTAFGSTLDWPRRHRWGALAALTGFYLLFIGLFAWSFGAWWPLLAFGWLLVGKLPALAGPPGGDDISRDDQIFRGMAAWAGMVLAYLGGCMLTLALDVPPLGIDPQAIAQYGLDPASEGVWESEPHRVVAFGVVYFSTLAAAKLLLAVWASGKRKRPG